MTDQILPQTYRVPPVNLIITTYELAEKKKPISPGENPYEWLATVTHIFEGDTVERVYQISDAHKKTDAFYAGSFQGRYNGIILKNSEFQIIK